VIDDVGTGMNPEDSGDGVGRGFQGLTSKSDVIIKAELTGNSINPAWWGVVGRWTSAIDYFLAWWRSDTSTVEIVNPSEVVIDTDTLALAVSDQGRITFTMIGDQLTALFENLTGATSVVLSATSSSQLLAPRHGLWARTAFGAGAADVYDNFQIETA
jgi:hypothetical protein